MSTHPLVGIADIPTSIPGKREGRIPLVLEAMDRMKEAVGGSTALYGLVTGPFTLASHLRGTDLFMDMILDPDYVHALLEYSFEVGRVMAGYYIEAGMDVIAAVDPHGVPDLSRSFQPVPRGPVQGPILVHKGSGSPVVLLRLRQCVQEHRAHVPHGSRLHLGRREHQTWPRRRDHRPL